MASKQLVLLALLFFPVQVQGQQPAPTELSPPGLDASAVLDEEQRPGPAWVTLHTLGGTLLGAWLGYIGSQMRYSDWDRDLPDDLKEKRQTYTAVGAALGTLVGLTYSIKVGPVPQQPEVLRPEPGHDVNLISREEIERAGLTNAFQLVETLRPGWMNLRGTQSWKETPDVRSRGFGLVTVREGESTILVYQNGMLLGDVNLLKDIPAVSVRSIRWLTPQEASYMYGPGNNHGAILVQTQ